jgi:cell division protein FtsL
VTKLASSKNKKAKKQKEKNKGLFNSMLFKLLAGAVIIGCAVLFVTTETDCMNKEAELAALQAQIDAYNIENAELQRTLNSDDLSAYMERIALEEKDYAYPDERRFYDTSRD